MDKRLIKVFEKTNYCINPSTVEEIIPLVETPKRHQLEIHFISGLSRKIDFDSETAMDVFIKRITG